MLGSEAIAEAKVTVVGTAVFVTVDILLITVEHIIGQLCLGVAGRGEVVSTADSELILLV